MRLTLKLLRRYFWITVPAVAATLALSLFVVSAETVITYAFADRGGASLISRGGTNAPTVGYARILPNGLNSTPAGLAIFGFRQGGVLVSEAGVPASSLIQSGRFYAEVSQSVNTGIAIANPNAQQVTISFYFTNSSGVDFGLGTKTIPPNSQFAAFLNELPFNSGPSLTGTFTFTSTAPVSVIALRGLTNERSEFLITTLPVTDLTPTSGATIFPHFADGGGWSTQVVLVNPTDSSISGVVQFFSQGDGTNSGQPLSIAVNGQTNTTFSYTVQRRSSIKLQTAGASSTTVSGSIRVTPNADQSTPSGLVIFSFKNGAFTVSQASVPAVRPAAAFRLYAEVATQGGSILTGVAVANPSSTPVTVNFELTGLIGGAPILTGTATIPGNGQVSKFLNQISGLESLPQKFKGVLRTVTSSDAGISVIGLRSRVNERGDFLITTTPPVNENAEPSTAEADFPHFVDDGGYTTQFILYSGSAGQQSSGLLRLIGQNGQPLDLKWASLADLVVTQRVLPEPPIPPMNAVTFAISVVNNGSGEASGIQLTDVLPSGAAFESVSTRQGACSASSTALLTCDLGSLSVGGSTVVNVVVRPPAVTTLTNAVTISGNEDDPVLPNNRSVVSASIGIYADLELTQVGPQNCSSDFPGCNGQKYDITVRNKGAAPVANVTVTDILPVDPFDSSLGTVATLQSAAPSQGSCSGVSNGQFSCNLGVMDIGATATLTVYLDIDPTATGGTVLNRASVSGDDIIDTTPGNNSQNAQTRVFPTPAFSDLVLQSITPSATSITRPTPLTLSIIGRNDGPSTATAVSIRTKFSGISGVIQVQSATSSQGSCSVVAGDVVCNVGTMRRTAQRNISIVVVPASAGQLKAEATIMNSYPFNPPGNATKSVTVTVN